MTRNLYALLVGIDNYPHPNHCLQGCVNDITAIAEYLHERFERTEYQLHLKTIKDEEATRKAVINGFQKHLICDLNDNFAKRSRNTSKALRTRYSSYLRHEL